MADWLTQLCNKHVNDLVPYESARRLFAAQQSQQRVWLNANESPTAGTYQIESDLLNRYPDCQPLMLLDTYAKYCQLDSNQIVVTRGADEGIELLVRAFCGAGKDSILICPPTYGMYAISARTFNVGVKSAPLLPDFRLDVASINTHVDDVKLVFICSPNNPTGTISSQQDICDVLDAYANKAIVVVDEAYIEFSAQSSRQALLEKYDNLVILRTLSKAFALAGIRCGFVLCSEAIKHILLKVIAPYPVPDPVAQIATQALSTDGLALMQSRVSSLNTSLDNLSNELSKLQDIELVGSQCGNFVLFRAKKTCDALMQYLVDNNMLIRNQSKQIGLQDCLRISIGTPAQNQQILTLIKEFYQK